MEDGWEPIDTAPDDHNDERTVNQGVRSMLVRDRDGKEWRAKRAIFNDSGWREHKTNKTIWPVWWRPDSLEEWSPPPTAAQFSH